MTPTTKKPETLSEKTHSPEEPLQRFVGIRKVKEGWITEGLKVVGEKVVSREVLREPDNKALAIEALKLILADIVLDRPWHKR